MKGLATAVIHVTIAQEFHHCSIRVSVTSPGMGCMTKTTLGIAFEVHDDPEYGKSSS